MSVIKDPTNTIEKLYNKYFDEAVSYINKINILTDKFNEIDLDDSDDLMVKINRYIVHFLLAKIQI